MHYLILYDAASSPTSELARAMGQAMPRPHVGLMPLQAGQQLTECDLLIVGVGTHRSSPGSASRPTRQGPQPATPHRVDEMLTELARAPPGWCTDGAFDTRNWTLLPPLHPASARLDRTLFRQGLRPVLPSRSFPITNPSEPSARELADAESWARDLYWAALTRKRLLTGAGVGP